MTRILIIIQNTFTKHLLLHFSTQDFRLVSTSHISAHTNRSPFLPLFDSKNTHHRTRTWHAIAPSLGCTFSILHWLSLSTVTNYRIQPSWAEFIISSFFAIRGENYITYHHPVSDFDCNSLKKTL
jgi:hypothetical protein